MKKQNLFYFFNYVYITNLVFAFFLLFLLLIYSLSFITLNPKLGKTNSIIILDKNEQIAFELIKENKGQYIELEKVNPYLIDALVSIEDQKFYQHKGIDISRLIQSFFINLFNRNIVQGGSTITQQLAKNLYFTNDKTLTRKIKEAYYALSLETHYDKNKIMEDYINSLYFGENIYGISMASNYFFKQKPIDLTLKESAFLAALINAPNYYSPKSNNLEALKQRINKVLTTMKRLGYINQEEFEKASKEELTFYYNEYQNDDITLSYYKDAVIDQLKKLGFYQEKYLADGLIIETTLNKRISLDLTSMLSLYQKDDPNIQVALVVLTPFTNQVITLIGGFSYSESSFNRSLNAKRQIGSTFKPFIYYLGLLNGMSPLTQFYSGETDFYIEDFGLYRPSNFRDLYPNRKINMIEALATSDNIYAVKTTLLLGSQLIVDSLIPFNIEANSVPAIALGSVEMTPLQLTSIYNTFASLGEYHPPSIISKIKTQSDNIVIYNKKDNYKKLLDKDTTIILNQLLRAPFDKKMISYINPTLRYYQPNDLYAAKSGSTVSDSYVCAYNLNVSFCVWVGTDDGSVLNNTPLAKEIFLMVANYFASIYPSRWYAPTSGLIELKIEARSGQINKEGSSYYFDRNDYILNLKK